jgi:iron complex outermembrane receptor protein
VVLDYKNIKAAGGAFGVSLAGNLNLQNERDGAIPQVKGTDVIDATQEALFFTSRPKEKFVLGISYDMERFGASLYNTYFGSTEFHQAGLSPDLKTVFDPKVVTDIGVTYNIWGSITIAANVNNIFDVIPEWKLESINAAGDAILSDPAMTKVQENLITFNGRYSIMTYDGFHFSQLGTIYNLSVTYGL